MSDKPDIISEAKTLITSIPPEATSITFPVRLVEELCSEIERLRAELTSREQDMTPYVQTGMQEHAELAAQVEELQTQLKASKAKAKQLRAEVKQSTLKVKPSSAKTKQTGKVKGGKK